MSTVAFAALTTNQIAGLATTAPAALATTAVVGTSTFVARADHQHLFPTAAQVGALGATATAGGDLVGNYPSPTLAAITTAQVAVGSSTVVPVLSVDAKGRVTELTTAAVAATSTTAITALTGDVTATGPGSVGATLASITTAQSNVGSSTQIPVLSIDAKGRVTALSSIAFNALTTNQIAGLATNAPAALATSPVVGLSTFAAREDHQHLFPTAAQVGAVSLAGDTMTGKLNTPAATTSSAGINIGNIAQTPTTQVSGDLWINGETMAFRSATAQRNLVSTSVLASFTAGVSAAIGSAAVSALAVQQNGTGAAITAGNVVTSTTDCVTITNLGSGNSLVVNDETTPDSTRFAIANNGKVGIGVAPDATSALTVDSGGVRFGVSGPTITVGANTPEGAVTAVVGSLFLRTNGGANTTLYVKESGTGNTGWIAK